MRSQVTLHFAPPPLPEARPLEWKLESGDVVDLYKVTPHLLW